MRRTKGFEVVSRDGIDRGFGTGYVSRPGLRGGNDRQDGGLRSLSVTTSTVALAPATSPALDCAAAISHKATFFPSRNVMTLAVALAPATSQALLGGSNLV